MTGKAGFNKLLALLFVIAAAAGLYFQFTYHKFLNNDTLSYINLAERYAEGNWANAINGFWSPLYCWILTFCKLAKLPLLQSCYVINFLVAGWGLYLLCKIARRYITVPLFYYAFSLYALLQLLFYAMSSLTPDLMSTVFGIWFLLLVTNKQFSISKQLPWIAGIAAVGMYFSKLYNFVPIHIFIAISVIAIVCSRNASKSKQIVPLLKTYGVFIVFCSIWITIISIHEKKFVITTAGGFNHNFMSPDYQQEYPTNYHLYPPPFPHAYSAHSDPAHLMDAYDWSPFSSNRNFLHQVNLITTSVKQLVYNLDTTGARWLILIGSLLILFLNRKKIGTLYDKSFNKIIWFIICYPLLYLPLFVLDRYVLTCIILFNVPVFYALQLAWGFINKKIFIPVIAVGLVASIIPFALLAQRKLTRSSGEYRYYKSFYEHLHQFSFLKDQSIASDVFSMVEATQFCYYFKCTYYSTWYDKQYSSLKQYPIRYLVSKKEQSEFPFLELTKKIPMESETIFIYEIK